MILDQIQELNKDLEEFVSNINDFNVDDSFYASLKPQIDNLLSDINIDNLGHIDFLTQLLDRQNMFSQLLMKISSNISVEDVKIKLEQISSEVHKRAKILEDRLELEKLSG